jgi:hypothetical protein
MPYVNRKERERIIPLDRFTHKPTGELEVGDATRNEGNLNFAITALVNAYLNQHGLNYKNINAVIGVLECCKLEAYRRIAQPYEDKKIRENGDAYLPELTGVNNDTVEK